jgi:hypothetical protein
MAFEPSENLRKAVTGIHKSTNDSCCLLNSWARPAGRITEKARVMQWRCLWWMSGGSLPMKAVGAQARPDLGQVSAKLVAIPLPRNAYADGSAFPAIAWLVLLPSE